MRLASILAMTAMAFSVPLPPGVGFGPSLADRPVAGVRRAPRWLASNGPSARARRASYRKPKPAGTKLAKKAARGRLSIAAIK